MGEDRRKDNADRRVEGHHLLSEFSLAGIAQAEDGKLMTLLLHKRLATIHALLV